MCLCSLCVTFHSFLLYIVLVLLDLICFIISLLLLKSTLFYLLYGTLCKPFLQFLVCCHLNFYTGRLLTCTEIIQKCKNGTESVNNHCTYAQTRICQRHVNFSCVQNDTVPKPFCTYHNKAGLYLVFITGKPVL